jgi:hypothetical protein
MLEWIVDNIEFFASALRGAAGAFFQIPRHFRLSDVLRGYRYEKVGGWHTCQFQLVME